MPVSHSYRKTFQCFVGVSEAICLQDTYRKLKKMYALLQGPLAGTDSRQVRILYFEFGIPLHLSFSLLVMGKCFFLTYGFVYLMQILLLFLYHILLISVE